MEKYQTMAPRFLALIVDFLIMLPVSFLAFFFGNSANSPKFAFVSNTIISIIPLIYTIFMHSFYGQTVGKMALRIKVVDIAERPITLAQSVIRSLPQMLPVFIAASTAIYEMFPQTENEFTNGFFGITVVIAYVLYILWEIGDIISALVSEKKRALHDLIAGTVVVKTDLDQGSV